MKNFVITHKITSRNEDSIDLYFKEVSKRPMLTQEEEYNLFAKGDEVSLNKVVESTLRFVISVAKSYQTQSLPLSDLINEGNIGLIEASKTFDHTKGIKFISYAVWHIRKCIINYIQNNLRMIRQPKNKLMDMREFEKNINKDIEKYGYHIGLEINKGFTSSLDELVGSEGDTTRGDLYPSDNSTSSIINKEIADEMVEEALSVLNYRSKDIIKAYFGMTHSEYDDGFERVRRVAEAYEITHARALQILNISIKRLQGLSKGFKENLLN